MDLSPEHKTLKTELKLAKTSSDGFIGRVEGHTAIWDEPDLDDDVFVKGSAERAAKELFPENKIKFRFNHGLPLGKLVDFGEDKTGIHFAGDISDTSLGRDVKVWIRDHAVDQSSLTFFASRVAFDEERKGRRGWPMRFIEEAFPILEVSPTDLGAQPRTTASLKSLGHHLPVLAHFATLYDIGALTLGEVKRALPFRDLPLAPRDRAWDASAAEKRVRGWAEAEEGPNGRYASAFLFVEADKAESHGAYRFLIADVVDEELKAIPRAVEEVAASLEHGPAADRQTLREHVGRYYAKMRDMFEDDALLAPWEQKTLVETAFGRLQNTVQGLREALIAR